jgi:hypothetical protein
MKTDQYNGGMKEANQKEWAVRAIRPPKKKLICV